MTKVLNYILVAISLISAAFSLVCWFRIEHQKSNLGSELVNKSQLTGNFAASSCPHDYG